MSTEDTGCHVRPTTATTSAPALSRPRKLHPASWLAAALVVCGAVLIAQSSGLPGEPLAGITPVEFEEFRLGQDDFLPWKRGVSL